MMKHATNMMVGVLVILSAMLSGAVLVESGALDDVPIVSEVAQVVADPAPVAEAWGLNIGWTSYGSGNANLHCTSGSNGFHIYGVWHYHCRWGHAVIHWPSGAISCRTFVDAIVAPGGWTSYRTWTGSGTFHCPHEH